MCGLFGAIGRGFNPFIVRALAVCNRERGTDALGFYDSQNAIFKIAHDPSAVLAGKRFRAYAKTWNDCWYVSGHTRWGTRGQNTDTNAHPFQYGQFIGAHNGIVDAPREYAVDSQFLIDSLEFHDGNYQEALREISGYWGLSWTNGESLFLQNWEHELSICELDRIVYFSSDSDHLKIATGQRKIHQLANGETWRFDANGNAAVLDAFAGIQRRKIVYDWRTGGTKTKIACAPPESSALPRKSILDLSDDEYNALTQDELRERWAQEEQNAFGDTDYPAF